MLGQHTVQFTSTTQIPVSLSSGESEWNGLVKGAACGLGVQSLLRDMGWDMELALHTDSSAARGIGSRRGAGRLKHIDTQLLWLQDHVSRKRLQVFKIDGMRNPADLGTKHLAGPRMHYLMRLLGLAFVSGAHKLALKAAV